MQEVNLILQLSHLSIIKYKGMTRDENMLNIVLEYASPLCPFPERAFLPSASTLLFHYTYQLTRLAAWHHIQVCREWDSRADAQGIWQAKREAGGELCDQDS